MRERLLFVGLWFMCLVAQASGSRIATAVGDSLSLPAYSAS